MTPERAKYILENKTQFGNLRFAFQHITKSGQVLTTTTYPDGITKEEDKFIHKSWDRMPGYTSYYDVVCRIFQGRFEEGVPSESEIRLKEIAEMENDE